MKSKFNPFLPAICAAAPLLLNHSALAANGNWNVNASGNWNTATNWSSNPTVPGTAAGDVIGINSNISLDRTVTITSGTNATIGTLNIGDTDASSRFTLALTGGSLTFNNNGVGAVINQTANSAGDTISAAFTLADNLTVNNNTLINGIIARDLTISGNITESGGARSLTKTGTGAVILSGTNAYTGATAVNGGALIYRNAAAKAGATATFAAGTTIGLGVGSTGFFSATDVNSAFGNTLANTSLNANTAIGIDTTGGNFAYSYGGGAGNTRSLVKYGANTLTLSGLSTTAANNYTGTTFINQGTLAVASDASLTGGLTFGAVKGSNQTSALDLSNSNLTTGALVVQTDTSANNTITIGSGKTLTTNGNVTIGVDQTGMTAGSTTARLKVSGTTTDDGTWNVTSSNGTFRVGAPATGSSRPGQGILDLSGLANFNVDLRTGGTGSAGGTFVLGENTGSASSSGNTLTLAVNSTIKAANFNVTSTGNNSQNLKLGSGTQIINAGTILMSNSNRDSSTLNFNTGTGTIQIRGAAGGSTSANLTMLTASATSSGVTSTFDVTGHSADMIFGNLKVMESTGGTQNTNTATFSFDTGTMSATLTQIGAKTAGSINNPVLNATVNIGSAGNFTNSAALGTLNMGIWSSSGTISGATTLNPKLNVAGSATSATFGAASMANYTGTAGATVNSEINVSGGSLTGTGGINMAAGNRGIVNSAINLTGGTLSVGTSSVGSTNGIYRTITGATVAPSLTVNGGALNLNGNAIGDATNTITTNFQAGTLSNVGEINGGAGLTKTTAGTLTLTGTNSYTGTTTVSQGTLLINGSHSGGGSYSVNSNATLGGTGSTSSGINVTGILSPGASIESLTTGSVAFLATSLLTYEAQDATGAGADLLNVSGDLSLTGLVTLDLLKIGNGSWSVGNKLTLISYSGSLTSNSLFSYAGGDFNSDGKLQDNESFTFDGAQWVFKYNDSIKGNNFAEQATGSYVTMTVVPEPSAALLGGLGVLAMLRRRRA